MRLCDVCSLWGATSSSSGLVVRWNTYPTTPHCFLSAHTHRYFFSYSPCLTLVHTHTSLEGFLQDYPHSHCKILQHFLNWRDSPSPPPPRNVYLIWRLFPNRLFFVEFSCSAWIYPSFISAFRYHLLERCRYFFFQPSNSRLQRNWSKLSCLSELWFFGSFDRVKCYCYSPSILLRASVTALRTLVSCVIPHALIVTEFW